MRVCAVPRCGVKFHPLCAARGGFVVTATFVKASADVRVWFWQSILCHLVRLSLLIPQNLSSPLLSSSAACLGKVKAADGGSYVL